MASQGAGYRRREPTQTSPNDEDLQSDIEVRHLYNATREHTMLLPHIFEIEAQRRR
jgi:hypothetical protein